MKTATYKKTGKGIIKIEEKDFNNNFDSKTVLLSEYQTLFNKICKGSNVLNFVKTSEYKEGLSDVLQDIMTNLIESREYENYDKKQIKNLLYQRLSDRVIDNFRKESTFDIFKNDYTEYVEDASYGVTRQYLHEMLLEVKTRLTLSEYKIFELYHVKGYSSYQIAESLKTSQSDIARSIKKINDKIIGTDKIDGLCFKTLFDTRYVAYNTGKKKRQHKRKVLTRKEIINLSGKVRHIDKESYIEPIKIEKESIPENKCLQYPTINYFKREKYNHSYISGTDIQIEYISTLVYGKSTLPVEIKGYSSKEYRRKRYVRKYTRNLKHGINLKSHALFDGHKSYLYEDGIQK